MLPTRLPRAHATIAACQAVGIPVLAGGAGFGADGRFACLLGADAWAPTADAAADRLAAGLPSFPAAPVGSGGSGGSGSAGGAAVHLGGEEYAYLTRHRADLLARVMDMLTGRPEHTAEDLGNMADFLIAATYVHDAALFTDFIVWTCQVLEARQVPAESVVLGLGAFHDVLTDCPDARVLLNEGVAAAQACCGRSARPADQRTETSV
ncbi:hypothetical protein [Microbispora bryophytorum]|uniref:hypothetical protein n=1 Tax=Microbispora bryophytorum TaxID=1460882 RepID=UPI0034010AAE